MSPSPTSRRIEHLVFSFQIWFSDKSSHFGSLYINVKEDSIDSHAIWNTWVNSLSLRWNYLFPQKTGLSNIEWLCILNIYPFSSCLLTAEMTRWYFLSFTRWYSGQSVSSKGRHDRCNTQMVWKLTCQPIVCETFSFPWRFTGIFVSKSDHYIKRPRKQEHISISCLF